MKFISPSFYDLGLLLNFSIYITHSFSMLIQVNLIFASGYCIFSSHFVKLAQMYLQHYYLCPHRVIKSLFSRPLYVIFRGNKCWLDDLEHCKYIILKHYSVVQRLHWFYKTLQATSSFSIGLPYGVFFATSGANASC